MRQGKRELPTQKSQVGNAYENQNKYHLECDSFKQRPYRKCKQCEFEFLNISGQIILHDSIVPLIAPFLFLRARNLRSILRLFSPVVLTPSESAIAMRLISEHSADIERKHSIIEDTKQKCSFLPRATNFPVTAWCPRTVKSRRLGPRKLSQHPSLIDVLFMSTPWQITTYCTPTNTIGLIAKGGESNYTL